jgi:uncharacterized protein
MKFEWDDDKAALNLAKHGVSFMDATWVFEDPIALYRDDPAHSKAEYRRQVMGISLSGILAVAYTERGGWTRLISARFANRRERRFYAAAQG